MGSGGIIFSIKLKTMARHKSIAVPVSFFVVSLFPFFHQFATMSTSLCEPFNCKTVFLGKHTAVCPDFEIKPVFWQILSGQVASTKEMAPFFTLNLTVGSSFKENSVSVSKGTVFTTLPSYFIIAVSAVDFGKNLIIPQSPVATISINAIIMISFLFANLCKCIPTFVEKSYFPFKRGRNIYFILFVDCNQRIFFFI